MKRRSLIAVVAAGMLLILGLVVVAAVLVITRTRWGQNQVRTRLAESIAPAVRGRAPLIGHIDLSSILSSVSVDTIAVYDASGELVFSCGRIEASYDLRDLLDSRIALHHLTVQNPFLHFRQHANGEWNFNEVFRRSNAPSRAPQPKGFSWGDYVVLDSVSGQNATFVLSLPWQPDDTLHGASADSAIQRELRRTDHAIARTADGFARTYTWKNATAFLPHVRLADPDSDRRSGRVIEIGDLGVDESDPPFDFRNVSGLVRLLGDSLWASIAHFELPGSRGEAHGTVVWGGDAPPRLAIHVRADSLSLDDINWVYPGLPRTGGGTALLTIKNEKDPHILDFRLDSMDVRSTKSRLTGSMTFGTGAPVLLVRDVDVVADPIDFDFIRALNGKDFPIDWRGQLFGLVRGPGGPLTDFAIDSMTGEWRDGHVNGAVSRVSGKGGLNIVDPGTPVFHDFQLTVGTLDLRSIEYLFPSFPRLAGVISGVATLDSSLYDVRFHDADLTHTDGLGEPTRVTGSGRITTGAQVITYDVALDANPLSFDLLARSYPSLPLRGAMAGPIRAVGQLSDLDIKTQLSGRAGAFSFDGRVSADSTAPGGYGATGQGELVGLDLQQLVSRETSPATVTGHYDVNLRGLSAADVSGTAALDLDHSIVDHMELSTGHANVAFGGGVARLSQPAVFSGPDWSATAVGGIGLPGGGATDSLMVSIASESLGPWRPYVSSGILDSVSTGRDSANVNIVGRVDAFAVNGRAWTRGVVFGADSNPSLTAHYVEADFALDDVLTAPHGSVALAIDSLHLASYAIDTASASLQLLDSVRTTFTADWRHGAGLAAHLVGAVSRSGGVDTIRLDTGFVRTDSTTRWWLDAAPAHLVLTGGRLDSVNAAFATDSGARVSVVGSMRDSSSVVLDLATSGAPLRSFALLAEADVPVGGRADLVASIRGPRSSPRITYSASLVAPSYDDIHVDGFTARGTYHDGRSTDTLRVFQGATSAVSADLSIPIGLSLFGYRLMPDSAVSGHVQNGNVDLQFLQPFLPSTKDSGVVTVSGGALSLEGTWRRPRLVGDIALHDAKFRVAALGSVVFDSVNAGVHFFRDSVVIDSLHAHSGAGRGDHSAMLAGSMAMQPDRTGWSRILSP
ncbi:MAG TPA: hypothetical protein VMH39_16230, partial [Gemmatimonadaceae bacterium]|nr:hypothetical protein [Gemmatimonadaceae bacterium]